MRKSNSRELPKDKYYNIQEEKRYDVQEEKEKRENLKKLIIKEYNTAYEKEYNFASDIEFAHSEYPNDRERFARAKAKQDMIDKYPREYMHAIINKTINEYEAENILADRVASMKSSIMILYKNKIKNIKEKIYSQKDISTDIIYDLDSLAKYRAKKEIFEMKEFKDDEYSKIAINNIIHEYEENIKTKSINEENR